MADSRLLAQVKAYRAALLASEAKQTRDLTKRYLAVDRAIGDKLETLAENLARLAAQGEPISAGTLYRLERWQQLQVQLVAELATFNAKAAASITAAKADTAKVGAAQAMELMRTAAGRATIAATFNQLPVAAITAIAGATADGSPLAALLAEAYPQVSEQIAARLVNGVALGINPRRVAAEARGALGVGLNRILTIARTEELRAYRTAAGQTYAANGIGSYKRSATFDERTCIGCLAADGEEMDEPEIFDAHPNCRCAAIPVVPGVAPPSWSSSQDWFNSQDEATQLGIMGPGRLEAYQSGNAGWSDLWTKTENETYGGAIVPTNVGDLPGAATATGKAA